MTLNTVTKSDNLIFMKRNLTATEAARNFSALLDSVEAGDEIEITRGKKIIAVIKQGAPQNSGEKFLEALKDFHRKFGPLDSEVVEAIEDVIADRYAPHNLVGGESAKR